MTERNGQISYLSCACWIRFKFDQTIIKINHKKFIDNESYIIFEA